MKNFSRTLDNGTGEEKAMLVALAESVKAGITLPDGQYLEFTSKAERHGDRRYLFATIYKKDKHGGTVKKLFDAVGFIGQEMCRFYDVDIWTFPEATSLPELVAFVAKELDIPTT